MGFSAPTGSATCRQHPDETISEHVDGTRGGRWILTGILLDGQEQTIHSAMGEATQIPPEHGAQARLNLRLLDAHHLVYWSSGRGNEFLGDSHGWLLPITWLERPSVMPAECLNLFADLHQTGPRGLQLRLVRYGLNVSLTET